MTDPVGALPAFEMFPAFAASLVSGPSDLPLNEVRFPP